MGVQVRDMKDWRGTEVKVGSTVVYPSRQGSQLWMSEGEVVTIATDKVGVRKKNARRISYPDARRITVIPKRSGRIIHGDAE